MTHFVHFAHACGHGGGHEGGGFIVIILLVALLFAVAKNS